MADIYVRSTDGSDADNGSTWALAKATLTGAAAIDAAGDTIYLSSSHAESTASAVTFALAGTAASPTRVLSVNDSAAPPTSMAAGASITTTGNSGVTFSGAALYVEGLTITCGSGAVSPVLNACSTTTAGISKFKSSNFLLAATGSASRIAAIGGTGNRSEWEDCGVRFAAAGQAINIGATGSFTWSGGSVLSGGTSPTTLFALAANARGASVERVDLSALSSTVNLVAAGGSYSGRVIFRNCKLPASWTGSLATGTFQVAERHEMHNCDSGDTNYRLLVADYLGSIRSEATIVRSSGASDGTTPFSWVMVGNTLPEFPLLALASPEIAAWNDTTGSAITVSVEIITDGVTLNDDECWLEVQYLGNSGFPLGSLASDAKADILASAAAQTTSTETWTTTGLSSPVKQKLSVTFTPQEAGYLQAVVKLAKASTTVYVDPLLTVT